MIFSAKELNWRINEEGIICIIFIRSNYPRTLRAKNKKPESIQTVPNIPVSPVNSESPSPKITKSTARQAWAAGRLDPDEITEPVILFELQSIRKIWAHG